MGTLLKLEDRIVSLDCITQAEFEPAQPGGEERFDEYSGQAYTTRPSKARLLLTLMSVDLESTAEDLNSGYHLAAASSSQIVRLSGELAEAAWRWLCTQSIDVAAWEAQQAMEQELF